MWLPCYDSRFECCFHVLTHGIGIGLNVVFDWLLVGGPTPWGNQSPFNFGAPGLVLATVAINLLTCLALLVALQQRISGLPLRRWGLDLLRLAIAGVLAAGAAGILLAVVSWPSGVVGLLLKVSAPGLLGLLLFALIGAQFKVAEVRDITQLLVGRFRSR